MNRGLAIDVEDSPNHGEKLEVKSEEEKERGNIVKVENKKKNLKSRREGIRW